MLGGLADYDMRRRPEGMNSLAWILWHVARAEDVVVDLVVTSGRQIFDDAWATRFLGATARMKRTPSEL